MSKAKVALKDAKILLSHWCEFIRNGMPSGKDGTDALKHALNKAFEEKLEGRDDIDDDDTDENVVVPVNVVQRTSWSTQDDNNVDYDDEDVIVPPIVVQQNWLSAQDVDYDDEDVIVPPIVVQQN